MQSLINIQCSVANNVDVDNNACSLDRFVVTGSELSRDDPNQKHSACSLGKANRA
jgi:hypothetical protein